MVARRNLTCPLSSPTTAPGARGPVSASKGQAARPSGWRRSRTLIGNETVRWWVMRRRFRLTVRVVPHVPLFKVEAFVSNASEPIRMGWPAVHPTSLEARIAVAKRWAEAMADELATAAVSARAGVR